MHVLHQGWGGGTTGSTGDETGDGSGEGTDSGSGSENGEGSSSNLGFWVVAEYQGSGIACGAGTTAGDGEGSGFDRFLSFTVEGDDNLLGMFYARASFLPSLPEDIFRIGCEEWDIITQWIILAKEVGVKAVIKTVDLEDLLVSEICSC